MSAHVPATNEHANWRSFVQQHFDLDIWIFPHHQAGTTGAMWLRRATSTRIRIGKVSLTNHFHHERPLVNSMSRRAVSPRYTSSKSFQPRLDSDTDKRAVDLEQARRVLRDTFGHQTFRPGQEEVITRLLSGESMVLAWPWRSGSSICYLVCLISSNVADKPSQLLNTDDLSGSGCATEL